MQDILEQNTYYSRYTIKAIKLNSITPWEIVFRLKGFNMLAGYLVWNLCLPQIAHNRGR